MKLVKVKSKNLILPLKFPQSIEGDKLEYFIRGEGHKKTKAFEILPDEIPDKWDVGNFLNVARYGEKYGLHVAAYLADGLVAGIIANQMARGAIRKWKVIKGIFPEFDDPVFFDAIKFDFMLSSFGRDMLDIDATDKALAKLDPDYNPVACTYKTRANISMHQYIQMKYGDMYARIIERLIHIQP